MCQTRGFRKRGIGRQHKSSGGSKTEIDFVLIGKNY